MDSGRIMDDKTFNELFEAGELGLILMDGGFELTPQQLAKVKEKSKEESKQKLERQGLNAIIFSYWEPNLASITATAAGILNLSMKKFQNIFQ